MDSGKKAKRLKAKDLVGKKIAGFQIVSPLGKGASGIVFQAIQLSTQQRCALKILTSKWASDQNNLKRFSREVEAAAKISHPNVVSVIESGSATGLFFMAMTLVEGRSLAQVLEENGTVPIQDVMRIGMQITDALAAVDAAGLVHRDIKPENIMISHDGRAAYLTDLGLAKPVDQSQDITLKGFTMGTPNYISPEQAMAEEQLTIGCDLYSLGATLFHALTGQLLFDHKSAFQVMQAHVKTPAIDPREYNALIPPPLAKLLLHLLEKQASKRPSPREASSRFAKMYLALTGEVLTPATQPQAEIAAASDRESAGNSNVAQAPTPGIDSKILFLVLSLTIIAILLAVVAILLVITKA